MKTDICIYRSTVSALLVAVVILFPEGAVWAQTAGGTLDAELGGGLCKIVKALTGQTGRAIASIGICILGIGAFFGKVNWGLAMTVSVGVMAMFSSMKIANIFAGGTAVTC
ncbi:MAG: hypothetical protein EB060_01955 [Proteobacteria bacterium]|nr:hypothetical protein [Pseudomonadota bacterium]